MTERIKKHWDLALIGVVGLSLAIVAMFSVFPNPVFSQTSTTVIVTAVVQEYMSFTSSATSTQLSPDLLDASGILHVGSSTDIVLTVNTSSADGYSISVESANDGLDYTAYTIQMTTPTTTVATGTDAFGMQASSTSMTILPQWDFELNTNDVGRATTTAAKFATKSSAGSGETATVKFLAACDDAQPAGTYTDTITFTLTATP